MLLLKPTSPTRTAKLLTFAFLAIASISRAATTSVPDPVTLWEVTLNFDEFAGQPGGWEKRDSNFDYKEYASKSNPTSATREYNIIRQNGEDANTKKPLFTEGLGGGTPLKITTSVYSSQNNPWAKLRGGITNQGISSQMETTTGTSRPGDWGLVSYRIEIPKEMRVNVANVGLNLDNVNGSGELYEWAFVTINERSDEILPGDIGNYRNTDFSDLSSSSYFLPDGSVNPAGTAKPTTPLAAGKTISQFLAGDETTRAANDHTVNLGWYAADERNVKLKDGPEAFDNPGSGTGALNNVFEINAASLGYGLKDETEVDNITIWMGYHDVAFDTNGDGTTRTGPNSQIGQLTSLKLGSTDFNPVPEPTTALMGIVSLFGLSIRRKRNCSK